MNYMNGSKYAFLISSSLLLTAQLTMADNVQTSPFVLYEQSAKNIIIDGVSTKYGLGVIGLNLEKSLSNNLKISGKLGYGQNNDQAVSFSSANFNGQVRGSYFDIKAVQKIFQNNTLNLNAEVHFINRELKAPDLTGARNGLALTGETNTFFNSSDIKLGTKFNISPTSIIKISAGISQWHLNAKATAYYAFNGITASAKKNINTIGQDPVFEAALISNIADHSFELLASSRSLRSKANTDVLTAQITYLFAF